MAKPKPKGPAVSPGGKGKGVKGGPAVQKGKGKTFLGKHRGSNQKRTKKFAQKHLEGAIKARRTAKKWKQRKEGRRGNKGDDSESDGEEGEEGEEEAEEAAAPAQTGPKETAAEAGFFNVLDEDESEDEVDDDGDDDDDDDKENSYGAPAAASSDSEGEGEVETEKARHKQQLQKMKEKDPEFFAYLKEHDASLLDFGGDSDSDGGRDDESEDGDEEGEGDKEEKDAAPTSQRDAKILTAEALEQMINRASDGKSFNPIRDLVRAFDAGCNVDEAEAKRAGGRWQIVSASVYETLMGFCVTKMDSVLDDYLDISPDESGRKNAEKSARFKSTSKLIKTYTGAVLRLLGEFKDTDMTNALLRHVTAMLHYYAPFPKTCRLLLKASLRIWGSSEECRVATFLLIRRMATAFPFPFIELCFKGLYLTFQRHAAFTNPGNWIAQGFMAQCVVELYGLDLVLAYEHAFVYLRQLAIQLRTAIAQNTKEARGAVSTWTFSNSLRLWGRLLTAYADQASLSPLVYPYVQIALGCMRMFNAPTWSPYRLQLAETLVHLATRRSVYIPLGPFLTEMLLYPENVRRAKQQGNGSVELGATLHLAKAQITTRVVQAAVVSRVLRLVELYLAAYAFSVSFPEIFFPVSGQLRKWLKKTELSNYRRQVKDLLETAERSADWTERRRATLEMAPKEATTLDMFKKDGSKGKDACPLLAMRNEGEEDAKGVLRKRSAADEPSDDEVEDMADSGDESGEEGQGVGAKGRKGKGRGGKNKKKRTKGRGAVSGSREGLSTDVVEEFGLSDLE